MAYIPIAGMVILLFSVKTVFGQNMYNPETSICCNGTISDKDGNDVCCGNVAYNYKKFVCCNGDTLPIPTENGIHYGCCFNAKGESKLTNMQTQQCCDGMPVDKPDPKGLYGCCNGQLYNETTHLCCDERIVERLQDQQCCVDKVFNASTETCCKEWSRGATIKWIPTYHQVFSHERNRTQCCSRGLYDPTTESCCQDQIKPRPKDLAGNLRAACCNEEPYDPTKQRCCMNGEIKDGKYVVTGHKIHIRPYEDSSACCSLELFDPKKEACCNATILPKPDGMDPDVRATCCDGQVHNYKTHLCHDNKLVQRNGSDVNADICGDQWYSRKMQSCCGGEVLELDSDVDCCWHLGKKYLKSEEACCDLEVVKLTKEDKENHRTQCCKPRNLFIKPLLEN